MWEIFRGQFIVSFIRFSASKQAIWKHIQFFIWHIRRSSKHFIIGVRMCINPEKLNLFERIYYSV